MTEKDREAREPYLFPPSDVERVMMLRRDMREARRRRYYASKRRLKGGRYEASQNGSS